MRQEVGVCRRCELHSGRNSAVFGEGPWDADLMLVGEAPGAEEDLQGRPFVGKAGQLLDKILASVGIRREEVFITNVVKCRPPNNRVPTVQEAKACSDFLLAQISVVRPKILVCLGSTPLRYLLGRDGITKLRGSWLKWHGIMVMPMFHPSFLLRNPSRAKGSPRHLTWLDIQEVKRRLEEVRATGR